MVAAGVDVALCDDTLCKPSHDMAWTMVVVTAR